MTTLPIPIQAIIICSPVILFFIITAVIYKKSYSHNNKYCTIYLRPDGRIVCPADDMNQDPGICKHCVHYKGYENKGAKHVKCGWHERLGGWNG